MADKKGTISVVGSGGDTSDPRSYTDPASSQVNSGGYNPFATDPYSRSQVYLGSYTPSGATLPEVSPFAPGVIPLSQQSRGYMNYEDAALLPTQWGENQLRQFVNQGILNKVPGFDVGMGMPDIQNAWQSMVRASIVFNQGLKDGQQPWTPYDVMNSYGGGKKGQFGTKRDGDWVYDVATGERIKYVGPTSKTTTSKHVDLSSPEDAQVLITQALRQALGRAPTAKELARFKSSITGYEQAHPEVTTTTQQLSPDLASGKVDVTSESSTTSGGVSDAARAALVQDPTRETKEYGKYQGATTFFGALMQMMGGS